MTQKIIQFAGKIQEYLNVVKAIFVGYDAFMKELKGQNHGTKEESI